MRDIFDATRHMSVKKSQEYFENEKRKHSALRDTTIQEFAMYWLKTEAELHQEKLLKPQPTAADLWNAICALEPDPLNESRSPAASPQKLIDLLDAPRFAPIPLGKLNGEYMCAMEPGNGGLGLPDDAYSPGLALSSSNFNCTSAIKYADSHLSEDYMRLKYDTLKDRALRRLFCIGYLLIQIPYKDWVKTGHVVVIDFDHNRKCHPWVVLANEWETDDYNWFVEHDTEYCVPAKKVKIDDEKALGVLPGTHNRTPIAKFMHMGDDKGGKFVRHFGPNFSFSFDRLGQTFDSKTKARLPHGPDLAEIMPWFQDPKTGEEVCFTGAGVEYLRYDPKTRLYDGPHKLVRDLVGNILETIPGSSAPGSSSGPRPIEATFGEMSLGPPGSNTGKGHPSGTSTAH